MENVDEVQRRKASSKKRKVSAKHRKGSAKNLLRVNMNTSQKSDKFDEKYSPRQREVTVVNTKKYMGVNIDRDEDGFGEDDDEEFSIVYSD